MITRKKFISQSSFLLGASLFIPACLSSSDGKINTSNSSLDRENLLQYQDSNGSINPVHTIGQWKLRKQDVLDGMQQVMGELPDKNQAIPLDMQTHWEVEESAYTIRFITYSTDMGDRVPAFLLVPVGAENTEIPIPAVLSPLGTGQSNTTFGSENLEKQIFQKWDDHRDWPRELAEQGYVVLCPAYPHLGEYRPDLEKLGYISGTMKAIWNNIRAMDLLDQLPYVRSSAYASIGHSLGGHNSIFTAVFDERIKVIVSSCGFDSFLDYMDGDISGWAQERYMPRIAKYELEEIPFDFHEMIGALAPRVFYANAPLYDSNFKWESAARVVDTANQIYSLYDASDNLIIDHPDAEHSFPDEQRNRAFELIAENLT